MQLCCVVFEDEKSDRELSYALRLYLWTDCHIIHDLRGKNQRDIQMIFPTKTTNNLLSKYAFLLQYMSSKRTIGSTTYIQIKIIIKFPYVFINCQPQNPKSFCLTFTLDRSQLILAVSYILWRT